MFNTKFGIEIEFTGITRNKAAKVIADHLNGTVESLGDYYDKKYYYETIEQGKAQIEIFSNAC